MAVDDQVYIRSVSGSEFRHGEILSELVQSYLALDSLLSKQPVVEFKTHPIAIILSQDCDLEQDFKQRQNGGVGALPNVLLCEMFEAASHEQQLRDQKKEDVWRRVFQNQDSRYQFLRAVPQEQDLVGAGLPPMVIDFKRYFTIPTDELYSRVEQGTLRRCRLAGDYAHHFAYRFHAFQSRIGIPIDHHR